MNKKILILAAMLITTIVCRGQPTGNCSNNTSQQTQRSCADSQKTAVSGTVFTIQNNGGLVPAFEELITGAPATVSIVIQGCGPSGTCDTLDTYTTVANAVRAPTVSKFYSYYTVTPSWTGGTNPVVTVNTTITSARLGSPGSSFPGCVSDGAGGLTCTGTVAAATALQAPQVTLTGATPSRCIHTDGSGNLVPASADCGTGGATGTTVVVCAGTNDTAAINTALSTFGHVVLSGSCAIPTTPLAIPSNTWLDVGIATVTCSIAPCISNTQYTAQTVNRTFATAVTTAGSTTLTSSTASFTGADQGQTIRCTGALGTAPTLTGYSGVGSSTLFTSITTVTNGTTILLADAAGVTFTSGSPTSCSILYRDHNIRITGGKFLFAGPTVGSSTSQHLLFGTVNDLTLQNIWFQNGTTGLSTTSGSKNVGISDASRVLVDGLTFNSWSTLQDGIDMYGPLRDFTVRDIYGHTGDNSIAVTIFGLSPAPSQGVVSGGLIENVTTAAGFGAIRLFGNDGGATVLMNDVTVRHYHAVISGGINGTGNGVEIFYGNFDNILVDDVSGMMQLADVYVAGATIGTLTARNLSQEFSAFSAAGSLFRGGVGGIAGVGPAINNLILDGLKVNGTSNNLPNFVLFGSTPCVNWTASVNHMQVNNSQFYNLSGAITGPFQLCDMTIGDLSFSNVQLTYNTANAPPTLGIITAANGAVGKVSLNGVHVSHQSGSLSGGSLFTLGSIGGVYATLGDLEMNDVSYTSPGALSGTYLWLSTPSGASPAYSTLSNIRLDHITGCNAYTGTGTGLVQMTSLFATNLATPSLCVAQQNGLVNVVAKASVTNSGAAIGTTILYTPPTAGLYRYDCNIATGSAAGTGTAIVSVLNSAAAAWIACPTLTFTAGAEQSCSVVVNKAVSSNLDYMTTFTAGSGGNYNLNCAVSRVQ